MQNDGFGMPSVLYAPLPFAILMTLALGIGGACIGLLPGVNTFDVTLSGAGAPWIGLIVVVGIAGVWYAVLLHRGYTLPWLAGIIAVSVGLALLVNALVLNTLAPELPDTTIGALGMGWLLGAVLGFIGLLGKQFVSSTLLSTLMGAFIGGLGGMIISFEGLLIMGVMYGAIGTLAGGTAALIKSRILKLF
jgi:hypothetical protein